MKKPCFGFPAAEQPIKKDELIQRMERIRKRICCYTGQPCDCKFGAKMDSGEQGGCPEIMYVMELLQLMTDREYAMLLKRSVKGNFPKQGSGNKRPNISRSRRKKNDPHQGRINRS